jgi:ATP-dependent RNA helicase RhlE
MQTGTGKTAGFTLPLLELLSKGQRAPANQVRALVLTPTRELAAQVEASITSYGKNLPLKSAVVFGGDTNSGLLYYYMVTQDKKRSL